MVLTSKAGLEQCDDGNIQDADGCSANCTLELGFNCTLIELSTLPASPPPSERVLGAPSVCVRDTCANEKFRNPSVVTVAAARAAAAAVSVAVGVAVSAGVAAGVAGGVAGGLYLCVMCVCVCVCVCVYYIILYYIFMCIYIHILYILHIYYIILLYYIILYMYVYIIKLCISIYVYTCVCVYVIKVSSRENIILFFLYVHTKFAHFRNFSRNLTKVCGITLQGLQGALQAEEAEEEAYYCS